MNQYSESRRFHCVFCITAALCYYNWQLGTSDSRPDNIAGLPKGTDLAECPTDGIRVDPFHPEGGANGTYFYVDPLNLAFVVVVTNEIILGWMFHAHMINHGFGVPCVSTG
jgi:hypothetical protein